MHQFDFGNGSVQCSPDSVAGFQGRKRKEEVCAVLKIPRNLPCYKCLLVILLSPYLGNEAECINSFGIWLLYFLGATLHTCRWSSAVPEFTLAEIMSRGPIRDNLSASRGD